MCTSIVSNRGKTLIGWNLDILEMEYRITATEHRVSIDIHDSGQWLPLFGANSRGEFITMPTCWPYDSRSEPTGPDCPTIPQTNIDLLLGKTTLREVRRYLGEGRLYSLPGVTYQAQHSDREGNVLQIVPGQGYTYQERPAFSVLTNFSPFKGNREQHPWMGWDRYQTAVKLLEAAGDRLDVPGCFEILQATAQTACPTVVSMVFDPGEGAVYWFENRQWDRVTQHRLPPAPQPGNTV